VAVEAVVIAGGSVYGRAAADGVAAWLGAAGRGYRPGGRDVPGVPPSPVIPAAILYDLGNGGDKGWGLEPPYRAMGVAAAKAAGARFTLGTAGAGCGAMAGGLKGGVGSASVVAESGYTVGALAAVNSVGAPIAPGSRAFWAAPFEIGDEFGGLGAAELRAAPDDWGLSKVAPGVGANTTPALIATDLALTPAEARRVAMMAQDGMARALRPIHTPFDGDVVFVLSTGQRQSAEPRPMAIARLGALAADCLARAIARGVYEARPWPGTSVTCWKDLS
ncbi:MAG: P1 family peptidase, partial [Caulobacterales bacterium]